jgi:hypothetical protein
MTGAAANAHRVLSTPAAPCPSARGDAIACTHGSEALPGEHARVRRRRHGLSPLQSEEQAPRCRSLRQPASSFTATTKLDTALVKCFDGTTIRVQEGGLQQLLTLPLSSSSDTFAQH